MTDKPETGDRIAKVMARAGVASRRDAERLIVEGRVAVNGKTVTSPALDVLPSDRVTLDGKPIDAPQPARLWLYYKPLGLVTSEKDEKGRQTVFESLPDGLPRVMSVGRLDLNSEGLLLLTNDGALKRRLELPSTGWLRKYRVRVNGRPNEATFDPLRRGVTIEGEDFLPMDISLDRQQGANAWLTVGLREGKNREIRRAMAEVGLTVNRLIRVSYGPFRLNEMKPGDVVEVKQKVLREQLGDSTRKAEPDRDRRAPARTGATGGPRHRDGAPDGTRRPRPARSEDGAAPDRRPHGHHGEKTGPRGPRTHAAEARPDRPRSRRPQGDEAPTFSRSGDPEQQKDRKPRKPRARTEGGRDDAPRGRAGTGERPNDRGPRHPRAENAERPGRGPQAPRADRGKPGGQRARTSDRDTATASDGKAKRPRSFGDKPAPDGKRDGRGPGGFSGKASRRPDNANPRGPARTGPDRGPRKPPGGKGKPPRK